MQNAQISTSDHRCSSKRVKLSGESKPGVAVGEYLAARADGGQSDTAEADCSSRRLEHPTTALTIEKQQTDANGLMTRNVRPERRGAKAVQMQTERAIPRPLQADC